MAGIRVPAEAYFERGRDIVNLDVNVGADVQVSAQERFEEAEAMYREAMAIQKDQRLERNRSLMGLGIVELKTGRSEGRGIIKSAMAEFQDMGAEWDVENARRALEDF